MTETESELLLLSQQLLDAIDQQDWETYTRLCDQNLTAFEPEAVGHLIEGLGFHQFYFQMESAGGKKKSTMSSPRVCLLGDSAVITYIRVVQWIDTDGAPLSSAFEETRVWKRDGQHWRHVHFHRSIPS